jgi:hypothetical protein
MALLPAGTWYLIVDGVGTSTVTGAPGDYALDVSVPDYTGVGWTTSQLYTFPATGTTVYDMATDGSELFYDMSASSVYSVGAQPKGGGTAYSKGTADGLTAEVLQYDIVEANGSIFSLDSATSTTTGRLWKIKDATAGWLNPPTRWDVPSGVTTSTWPGTNLYALTFDGTDLIVAMPGTSATAAVAFYAVSATAPELPRYLGAATVAYSVRGIAADAKYFYVAGSSSGWLYSGVWRIDRQNLAGQPLKIMDFTGASGSITSMKLDSLSAPKYLYARASMSGSPIMVVENPAGPSPVNYGALFLPGMGTQTDVSLGYDRTTNTLYYVDTATNSKGVIWKVQ